MDVEMEKCRGFSFNTRHGNRSRRIFLSAALPPKTEFATGSSLPVDDERSQSDLEEDQERPQSRRWYRALLSFLEIETHGYVNLLSR